MTPLLARGYVLTYDMVFVPRLELTRSLLGLGTAVARAVPGDLLVALASRLVPADLVQKLILLGIVVTAGIGAARLTPTTRPAAKGAAAASTPGTRSSTSAWSWATGASWSRMPSSPSWPEQASTCGWGCGGRFAA